jgi:hypothetical protein
MQIWALQKRAQQTNLQIRMVARFAEMIEREETLVAEADLN